MNSKAAGDDDKTEPKENDKWMDNDKDIEASPKSPSRLEGLQDRMKQLASNKFHLIIVLLCIVLFIFFLIVIVLSVQLGTYRCPENSDCRTPECLETASRVVAATNDLADPCDDFWAYSCGGWSLRNPLPRNRGSFGVSDLQKTHIASRIRHLIDVVPYDADSTSPQWKVKNFFTACRNLKEIESWVPRKLLQDIHEIGGWAVIKDSPGGSWNRNDVLKTIQVAYGVKAFFQVVVEADDENPLTSIIKLKPAGLGLPSPRYYFKPADDPYVQAYQEFIKNTVHTLDVSIYDARRLAEEVFNYERRLAEVTPNPEGLRNTKELYTRIKVKDLDSLSFSINWTEILQSYFPGIVTPDTEIAVLSLDYFKKTAEIISSTETTVLNNYYMWRFLQTYVPHSASRFRLLTNSFKQSFEGVKDTKLSSEDNWEFCIDVTSNVLGHAIGAMYVEQYFPKKTQEQVSIYLHKLLGAMSEVARNAPWLSGSAQEFAQLKIRSLGLLIGYPGFIPNHIFEYYKELKVETDYLQNLKHGVYFLRKKQGEMLLKGKALSDYSWTVYPHEFAADYKYAGNQLIVPAGLFEEPLFDVKAPLAVKYGILASQVANSLAEMFDGKGIDYDEIGKLTQWVSNSSLKLFHNKENCLKEIANVTLYDVQMEPDLLISSIVSDIGGVKIAYEAFKKHAKESEEGELPGTAISNDQLFFISYAQALCQNIRPEKLAAFREANMQLPDELRVRTTLQQFSEFSKVFSCSRGSAMSSKRNCRMW